jgi:hypothetical protein
MVPFAQAHTCRSTLELVSEHACIGSICARCLWPDSVITTVEVKKAVTPGVREWFLLRGRRRACAACGYGGICVPRPPGAACTLCWHCAWARHTALRSPQWWHLLKYSCCLTESLLREWKHKRNHHPRRIRFFFLKRWYLRITLRGRKRILMRNWWHYLSGWAVARPASRPVPHAQPGTAYFARG